MSDADRGDTAPNVHPNIRFRITGYRSIGPDERLSNGRAGHWSANHHIFPEGSFPDVMARYPIGTVHDHVPAAPCRYEMVFDGPRDMLAEQRQLHCRLCYPIAAAVDHRKAPAA
jgi:hypothetical protein